jgi:hypothetical protein
VGAAEAIGYGLVDEVLLARPKVAALAAPIS